MLKRSACDTDCSDRIVMATSQRAIQDDSHRSCIGTQVTTSIPGIYRCFRGRLVVRGSVMGFYAFKARNERRILRRSLRMSESEVSSLRGLPLSDAD